MSILVACLLLFCLARFCHRRNKLAHSNNIHELLDIVETDSTLTRSWVGNKITGIFFCWFPSPNHIFRESNLRSYFLHRYYLIHSVFSETVHFSECKLSELPCISRQTLKLERSEIHICVYKFQLTIFCRVIGHGAFGEVYEGTLFYSDGQNIKVTTLYT